MTFHGRLYALNCQTPSISKAPKKFLARPPQTETQPQKAKIEHFLMKEPKVSLRLLKRREIVNLSPLFYALKRRRVHKFGFAAAA